MAYRFNRRRYAIGRASALLRIIASCLLLGPGRRIVRYAALTTLLLIDQYRNSGRRSLQLSAAFACGIACLARYPGVALVVAGIIVPLWPGQRWRRRLVDTGIFMVFAAAPPTAWLVRNAAVSGSATARDLLLHSIPYWKWMTGLDTLAS